MAEDRGTQPPGALHWQTLLLPGLGHWRLGDRLCAALAFGSCALLFWAGYAIVQDRLYYYALLSVDRDSMFAQPLRFLPVLNLPESLNLLMAGLGTTLAFEPGYEAERLWRLPRAMEHLGSWLTAAAGMLAALWAADVHFQARARAAGESAPAPRCQPALAAGLSWLLPGLGHARAGQAGKGLLMGAAVLLVWAFGLLVSQGHAVDRPLQPVWWIAQDLFGGGTLVAALTTAPLQFDGYPRFHDLGVVLCTVAGLMNLVVMVDAYTVAERTTFPAPDRVRATGEAAA
jgi:hypothetical protein